MKKKINTKCIRYGYWTLLATAILFLIWQVIPLKTPLDAIIEVFVGIGGMVTVVLLWGYGYMPRILTCKYLATYKYGKFGETLRRSSFQFKGLKRHMIDEELNAVHEEKGK